MENSSKKYINIMVVSIIFTLIICNTILRPFFKYSVPDPKFAELVITATGEKNEAALNNNVRISKIRINGIERDPISVITKDNWRLDENNLIASYDNNEASSLNIVIVKLKTLELEFVKQEDAGMVNINVADEDVTLDLYTPMENGATYVWKYHGQEFFSLMSNPLCLVIITGIIFSIINIIILLKAYIEDLDEKSIYKFGNCIAALYLGLTFFTDRFAFRYNNYDLFTNARLMLYKGMLFVLLMFVIRLLLKLIINIKKREKASINFIKYFLPYWAIMTLFLLMAWPGTWRWDEIDILNNIIYLGLMYWQHYLTSIYYILGFMILPFPGGLVFLQITLMSVIVGYSISKISKYFNYSKLCYLMYIPFLLPATIDQNMYPIRLCIYAYVELFYFVYLYLMYKENSEINWKSISVLSFTTALLASWRSEGIIFLFLTPVAFIVLFYKRTNLKSKISAIFSIFIMTMVLMAPQSYYFKSENRGKDYKVSPYIEFVDDLVKHCVKVDPESEELKKVARVLNIDVVLEKFNGEEAFWNGGLKVEFTDEDFAEFKKGVIGLLLKYPDVYLKERFGVFLQTSGMYPDTVNQVASPLGFYQGASDRNSFFSYDFTFNRPINKQLREKFINFIECRQDDYNKTTVFFGIFYNLFIPLGGLLLAFILSIKKKNLYFIYLSGMVLMQHGLMFLIAPSVYFMYYFPLFIIGIFIMSIFLVNFIYKRKLNTML